MRILRDLALSKFFIPLISISNNSIQPKCQLFPRYKAEETEEKAKASAEDIVSLIWLFNLHSAYNMFNN
jgi:hypothetical protein